MSIVRAFLINAALMAAACGPKVDTRQPSPFEHDDPRAGGIDETETADLDPPTSETATVERVLVSSGTVSRSRLVAVLDEGVQPFLAGINMKAHFANKRFAGWRIVSFWPGDSRYENLDLVPGDIVSTVNGKSFERPEQFFSIWRLLRKADAIVVRGTRGNATFELRFLVTE